MICKESLALIPGYLDGELSDAQAAPLRQHLIDCQPCRKAASGGKSLKRWFEHDPGADVEVPIGFAARVARRAFAGDTGEAPIAADAEAAPAPILRFLLGITAAAAALLLVLSAWMHGVHLPDSENIHAVDTPSSKQELIEKMDRTNARAADGLELPAAETEDPGDGDSPEDAGR